jgi:hypothetical protein
MEGAGGQKGATMAGGAGALLLTTRARISRPLASGTVLVEIKFGVLREQPTEILSAISASTANSPSPSRRRATIAAVWCPGSGCAGTRCRPPPAPVMPPFRDARFGRPPGSRMEISPSSHDMASPATVGFDLDRARSGSRVPSP